MYEFTMRFGRTLDFLVCSFPVRVELYEEEAIQLGSIMVDSALFKYSSTSSKFILTRTTMTSRVSILANSTVKKHKSID